MGSNKNIVLCILILAGSCSIFGDCSKRKDCNELPYSFRTSISATPGIDSIPLGDTVWFVINDSVLLRDALSGELINYKNAKNLSFVFGIRKVLTATSRPAAASLINYFVRKGNLLTPRFPDLIREFRLVEEGSRYILEVGLIPLERGIYDILVENSANVYTDWTCRKANFSIKFSNADQHFYLGYNISGDGVYYFKVY